MARGPKKHLKRLNAPRHWMLDKISGKYATRASTGPHKLRECVPLTILIRNRLKYALSRREVTQVVMRRLVNVDGKPRTDTRYPTGFQDVVTFPRTDEQFRMLYDVKGRFVLHRITKEEAKYKLCRVIKVAKGSKNMTGRNPLAGPGQAGVIPYLVSHDGRTIRFADPAVKVHDTIKFDLESGKQVGHIKFEIGNLVMVTKGGNTGRIGVIVSKESHPGSFDIVHIKDRKNNAFATRLENVFVIGEGSKPEISLPKGKGVQLSIMEERDAQAKKE